MATATKTSKPASNGDETAKRKATASANASLNIDFSRGKPLAEIKSSQAQVRGLWVAKLAALKEAVESGSAEAGVMYPIGTFTTASGARTAIRELSRKAEALPGTFDLEAVVVVVDGKRQSELWAGLAPEDEPEVG